MADDDFGDDADLGPDDADIQEDFKEMEGLLATEITGPREVAKESRALQFLSTHHPEARIDYIENVLEKLQLSSSPPDHGVDKNHKSVPYLTLFEKSKVLGFRANQLSQGAQPLIEIPSHVTDVLEIARLELLQKRLPFIIKRPMPDGTFEYWRLADLILL
jgi:DNA-directed RNA polymerase I, II, and III subunit RPABC2